MLVGLFVDLVAVLLFFILIFLSAEFNERRAKEREEGKTERRGRRDKDQPASLKEQPEKKTVLLFLKEHIYLLILSSCNENGKVQIHIYGI